MPITRSIRQCFLALLLVAAVASCGSHSNSGRAPQTAPLSQRLSGLSGQFDLLPPWFTTATEAGPLTRFSVDGAATTTTWVEGQGFTIGKASGANTLSNYKVQKTDTSNLIMFRAINSSCGETLGVVRLEFAS